jgi:hypothetical protein
MPKKTVQPQTTNLRIRMKRDNQVTPHDGPMRLAKEGDVVEVAPHEGRHQVLIGNAEIADAKPAEGVSTRPPTPNPE